MIRETSGAMRCAYCTLRIQQERAMPAIAFLFAGSTRKRYAVVVRG